jgi:hypothetical protein
LSSHPSGITDSNRSKLAFSSLISRTYHVLKALLSKRYGFTTPVTPPNPRKFPAGKFHGVCAPLRGESREQIIMLPDCIDDYITDNNSVRVIEAYINSLDLTALNCGRIAPQATGRPIYVPKDLFESLV